MKIRINGARLAAAVVLMIAAASSFASGQSGGKVVTEVVHGKSLENTVTKENPDRNVAVYLPPSYDVTTGRRYPVLYLLHGIGDDEKVWLRAWQPGKQGFDSIPALMDNAIAYERFGEFIVVMPDGKTNWFGSFYVDSDATGGWEQFFTKDLVEFIDGKYRTIAAPGNRAVAGHSMGGYGAITLGMKHPEVFGTVYGMNPAIIDWGGDLGIEQPGFRTALEARSYEDLLKTQDVYVMGSVTVCQAFSPNPANPPFFCDMPFRLTDGKLEPSEPGFSKWADHSPIRMVPKYRDNLRKLKGLKFDSGYEDEFRFIPINSRELSKALTNNGIDHVFEEYNGDHRNRLWGWDGRILNEVMPFVWDRIRPPN